METLSVKLTSSLAAFSSDALDGPLLLRVHLSATTAPGTFPLQFIHPRPLTASAHVTGGTSCLRSLLTFQAAGSSSGAESGPSQPPRPLAQADSVAHGLSWGLLEPQDTASHLVGKGGMGEENPVIT